MAGDSNVDGTLLGEVERQIREISEQQHELARRQRILVKAATQLRLGWAAAVVLAEIRAQSPYFFLDRFDPGTAPSSAPPLRPVRRIRGS
jgi:hypothetical protein